MSAQNIRLMICATHTHTHTHTTKTHSPLQASPPPAEINIHAWRVLCYRSATRLTKWSFAANPCASELCWERIPLTAERCPQTCFKDTPGLFEVQENWERRCLGGFSSPDAPSPPLPLSYTAVCQLKRSLNESLKIWPRFMIHWCHLVCRFSRNLP